MLEHGLEIGIGLLIAVAALGWWLGYMANRNIRQFREEQHENFLGRHHRE